MTQSQDAAGALIKIAAELLLCKDLPDPDDVSFRPMGKRAVRDLYKRRNRMANAIRSAVDDLRTTQEPNQ